ncbi:MAG TPA: phosphatase PAP2 family protein [Panacibacter sp.]|nr:phosphatase PAP2 family protein [Panacibacter sp.]HNP45654.1 phosphatase PAP2 family protein [Panacibacter sp.]
MSAFWANLLSLFNHLDQYLFLKVNGEWTNHFLDSVFPWWRDSNTWLPFYLFIFLLAVVNFGWRIWPWVVCFIITVTLTDQVSSGILKNWINRPRPCNDEVLMYQVRLLLSYCPGNGSFTSSHATNHFGMACFLYFTLRPYVKKWGYLFFFWAATISYGQVYVGIHYPFDVICGAILGSSIGCITASIFNRRIGLPPLISKRIQQPVNMQ